MFRFANPEYLYLLFILPFIVVFYIYAIIRKRKAVKKYGNPKLLAELMPEVSPKRQHWKFWFLFGAITLMIFVIAGPQFGSKLETIKRQGVEIMVCLDVSNSMLAEDVAPNRLEKAKQMLSRLTDGFSNDKVGLIVFAGDAFTQLPITSDYISAKMFLSSINPSMVSAQGTAIGAAINLAVRSFTPSEASDKTIILITDGENHEDDAIGAAKNAADRGINVNIVGMGLPQGSPIPLSVGSNNFMKDNQGNVVITRLNEQMCQDIAAAGNGMYVRADNTNSALRALQAEIEKMNKAEIESKVYTEFDEQFHVLAWIVLFILIIDFLTIDRKSRFIRKLKLFS
jgi:Ca-activated chloride channel family protein